MPTISMKMKIYIILTNEHYKKKTFSLLIIILLNKKIKQLKIVLDTKIEQLNKLKSKELYTCKRINDKNKLNKLLNNI